ncbi:MAG TPA: hypothetical protein VK307_05370 [Thermoleophilaceae bacterium]|nr:hypothetical protein [Thermoleophilaceae bacterium]
MNPIRRLLLGSGRFPAEVGDQLRTEGVEVLDEGRPGSITYRDYRAPGKRFTLRKVAVNGAVALTSRRVIVWYGRQRQVDIPVDDPLLGELSVGLDQPDRICLSYAAEAFHADRSGTLEVRLTTDHAQRLLDRLTALGARAA